MLELTKPDLSDLRKWYRTAPPGQQIIYHKGFLMRDRGGRTQFSRDLDIIAKELLDMEYECKVFLTQEKVGEDRFLYIATKATTGYMDSGRGYSLRRALSSSSLPKLTPLHS